jgi:hypothetical protein
VALDISKSPKPGFEARNNGLIGASAQCEDANARHARALLREAVRSVQPKGEHAAKQKKSTYRHGKGLHSTRLMMPKRSLVPKP